MALWKAVASLFSYGEPSISSNIGPSIDPSDILGSIDNTMEIEFNDSSFDINPATGLPMIEDSGIDVAGNPYGTDLNDHLTHHSGGGFDNDLFDHSSGSFDNDPFDHSGGGFNDW